MLDPAIIHDMQRALAPPMAMPPAIEREWVSPTAERAKRVLEPWIADAEAQGKAWRAQARDFERGFDSIMDMSWDDQPLDALDKAIGDGERNADGIRVWADNLRRDAMRANRVIKRIDLSSGLIHARIVDRFVELQRLNVESLRHLVAVVRAYRNLVDTRSGAGPDFVGHPWRPNATTLAAIRDAELGHLEDVTLDDLRAEILADD